MSYMSNTLFDSTTVRLFSVYFMSALLGTQLFLLFLVRSVPVILRFFLGLFVCAHLFLGISAGYALQRPSAVVQFWAPGHA